MTSASHAASGINQTLSFQGRLQSNSGAVVPDGYYNIEFNIYQDGDGTQAGDTGGTGGTLKWTEDYVNNNGTGGVRVKDGFFSVNLGSKTPFGTSVDWNQDTLWLSMNIGGSDSACTTFGTAPCSADGEMLPMKRLTATPFALNSAKLGGIGADGFIQNQTASPQAGDFNIAGTGIASTLQGNTSVVTPLIDSTATGVLGIGRVNATGIIIGSDSTDQTIQIGAGIGNNAITIGNREGTSSTIIQGGSDGVAISTRGGFVVKGNTGTAILNVGSNGDTYYNFGGATNIFSFVDADNHSVLNISGDQTITTSHSSTLSVRGNATFNNGLTVQGTGGSLLYTTPGGANLTTAINIPSYTVGNFGSVLAFGLPSTSAASARGMLVADGRLGTHQATIGVLSPDEDNIMGLSWKSDPGTGANAIGTITNTADSLALQGNGLNLLTATNNSGQANVGIGNNASSGYALDVTGDTNTSDQYRINGSTALTSSSLGFSAATTSTINAASGQVLNLASDTNVSITTGSTTSATFANNSVQIGSGTDDGTTTVLSLDKATSAPTGAALGSMYYDTTLGKVQCYQDNGWGACGNSPDTFVTLSPEYSNAVMNATGDGDITTDFCSDSLDINNGTDDQPNVCGDNETYNYYGWTSTQTTAQTRSIYVTYQLPSTFKNFVEGATNIMGRTDDDDATTAYQIYKSHGGSALTPCSSAITVSNGAQTGWLKNTAANTDDPANCDFEAGDSIIIRVDLTASNGKNAYVSNLNFAYSNE